jgi:hypothetical protein
MLNTDPAPPWIVVSFVYAEGEVCHTCGDGLDVCSICSVSFPVTDLHEQTKCRAFCLLSVS